MNGLPVATSIRSSSKERRKEALPPSGSSSVGAPLTSSGTQNLISVEGENLVDEREIYTSDSSDGEDMGEGAYGGYVAQLMEGKMPVDLEEYLSDESTDMSFKACNYRNARSRPTPPRPHPHMEEGAYHVIADHEEYINMSSYF